MKAVFLRKSFVSGAKWGLDKYSPLGALNGLDAA
jgi:hypothetical protein